MDVGFIGGQNGSWVCECLVSCYFIIIMPTCKKILPFSQNTSIQRWSSIRLLFIVNGTVLWFKSCHRRRRCEAGWTLCKYWEIIMLVSVLADMKAQNCLQLLLSYGVGVTSCADTRTAMLMRVKQRSHKRKWARLCEVPASNIVFNKKGLPQKPDRSVNSLSHIGFDTTNRRVALVVFQFSLLLAFHASNYLALVLDEYMKLRTWIHGTFTYLACSGGIVTCLENEQTRREKEKNVVNFNRQVSILFL